MYETNKEILFYSFEGFLSMSCDYVIELLKLFIDRLMHKRGKIAWTSVHV